MPSSTSPNDPRPSSLTGLLTRGDALERVRTTCIIVLTLFASGVALAWLRPVVVPFLVALALYYLLSPVGEYLVQRLGVSHGVGILGATLLGICLLGITGALVWRCIAEIAQSADDYSTRISDLLESPDAAAVARWIGLEQDEKTGRIVLIHPEQTRSLVRASVTWLKDLLTDFFLVLVFLLFMLVGSSRTSYTGQGLPEEAARRVRRYLIEMFMFSVLTGVLVGAILGILGVKFWLAFGFLAFVLNFIPTLGSIAATILPIPVVLLDPSLSVTAKVLALALPALVQIVVGNVIQPRFQSRTQGVHPVAAIFSLIILGMIWGAVGAILAVPLTAVLKIAFEKMPGAQAFARIMEGQLGGTAATSGEASA